MYQCPVCGQDDAGFVEELENCVVVRTVDNGLNHVDTRDWERTPYTVSRMFCPICGQCVTPRGNEERRKGDT